MNIQQLRVFTVAARSRTLMDVAAELQLKQPTITFHLNKMEKDLGVQLFARQSRPLRLTKAGEALLPYARRMVALFEEMEGRMQDHRDQSKGKLKLGASYTPATYFLPPHLAAFQGENADVASSLTVKKSGAVLKLLREYEVDGAVVSLPEGQVEGGLQIVPLIEDDQSLVLSPRHLLAGKADLTVGDLQGEAFLVHESGSTSREMSDAWARDNGLVMNIRMELGAIETIKEAVKYGMGLSILPRRCVERERELAELAVRELPGIGQRRWICLVYRAEDGLTSSVRSFIEFLGGQLGIHLSKY